MNVMKPVVRLRLLGLCVLMAVPSPVLAQSLGPLTDNTIEPAAPSVEFVPPPRILVASHGSNLLEATTRASLWLRWTF